MFRESSSKPRMLQLAIVIIGLMACLPTSGWGQAVLGLSTTPASVVKTGQTELLGPIYITVTSGTTLADTLQLNLSPAVIANPNPSSGITLTGTGGLAGASIISIVADAGVIAIAIPAGAAAGSNLTLSGIRTSVPALNGITSIDVRVSLGANFLAAGQTSGRVMSGVGDAIVVDPESDESFTVSINALLDPLEAFTFREGIANAFSSAVGTFGQTQATQVIFQLTGLPDGVSVTFPTTITGTSGGVLQSLDNAAVSNLTFPPRKVYNFTEGSGAGIVETFTLTPTVNLEAARGSGTVFLQVAMGPLGSASNVIPRYAEQFLPAITGGTINTRTLVFPVANPATKVVVSNVSSGAAVLTARARQADGTIVSGAIDANFNVPGRQSVALVPSQIFAGANLNSLATLEVESQSRRIVGSSLDKRSTGSYVLPFIDEANNVYLSFDRQTSADIPVLSVSNGNNQTIEVTLTLRSSIGQTVTTVTRSIQPLGLLRNPLTTLFNVQSGGFPLNGYVLVTSAARIRATLLNHPDGIAESVAGVATVGQIGLPLPFFVFGGGYNTTANLINGSATAKARFTLTPYQPSGAALAGATPYTGEINPGERLDLSLTSIFGPRNSVTIGYLSLTVDPITPGNPFSGPPPVAGLIRISVGNSSTTVPVAFNSGTELFLTPTADAAEEYTGLAILNTGTTSIEVTAELTTPDGIVRGTTTFTLAGRTMRSQLIREWFSNLVSHQDGTIRISSSQPVFAVGFRGTFALSDLVYIPAQTAPQ